MNANRTFFMYSNLTATELKSLLADRAIPGRSKATTKAAMIALLEAHDAENFRESEPTPVPALQPEPEEEEPEEEKRTAPSAPRPIRRTVPLVASKTETNMVGGDSFRTLSSGGGQIAATRAGESAVSPAQEIAEAIAQALAPLSQEIAALRHRLANVPSVHQSPGEAFPPPGPWLNQAGELRPDFIDWIAAQWRKSFPNRASQTDWQIRGDVFKHLQKPGKLTPAWVSFENDMGDRAKKLDFAAQNNFPLPVPHPLSGVEVVGSVSTEDKYSSFTYPIYQATDEAIAQFEAFKSRMVASTVSRLLPFPSPQSAPELAANLKSLANKFDMNQRPKSPEFSSEHYQAVARSYRARYAVALSNADEEEF